MLKRYLEMYNLVSQDFKDLRESEEPPVVELLYLAELQNYHRLLLAHLAEKSDIGIEWGSYGATLNDKVKG